MLLAPSPIACPWCSLAVEGRGFKGPAGVLAVTENHLLETFRCRLALWKRIDSGQGRICPKIRSTPSSKESIHLEVRRVDFGHAGPAI